MRGASGDAWRIRFFPEQKVFEIIVYLMGLFKQIILNQCFGKTEGFIIKDECIDCMDDCDCMHV